MVKSASRAPIVGTEWRKPPHLKDESAKAWRHVVGLLREAGTLELTDPTLVECYAVNVGLLRKAHESVAEHGLTLVRDDGTERANPACNVVNTASMRIKAIVDALGLCPATSKFSAAKTHGESEVEDKWDGLLGVVAG